MTQPAACPSPAPVAAAAAPARPAPEDFVGGAAVSASGAPATATVPDASDTCGVARERPALEGSVAGPASPAPDARAADPVSDPSDTLRGALDRPMSEDPGAGPARSVPDGRVAGPVPDALGAALKRSGSAASVARSARSVPDARAADPLSDASGSAFDRPAPDGSAASPAPAVSVSAAAPAALNVPARPVSDAPGAPPADPSDAPAAIRISDLRKTYAASGKVPAKEALKGVSLTIRAGSIFGLLGPNGAGKSTTINIMAGLVNKTAGRVEIWGFDQDVNPRQSRAAIGVMPQELNIDPFFTPRASLEVQAGLYGVPKRERWTDEILALVGLTEQAESYTRQLSGGMKRRLLLAKALVHRPRILVLDEPTAGVDIALREMLWANVRRLNEQGMTIILTTHYLEEAQAMCDEIAIIDRGRLIVQDRTEALLHRTDRKTLLVDPGPDWTGAPPPVPEGVTAERRPDGRLAFSYAPGRMRADRVIDALRGAGLPMRDVASEQPDLEDVFRQLTGGAG